MSIQKTLSIEEISSRLKPILGNKIDELYFRYTVSDSLEEKNQILCVLGALYQKHLGKFLDKKLLLEPPEEKFVLGEYDLARVIYAGKELHNFCLRENDWPRHVCISGMSGSGKTTLALNILQRFVEKDKPFLVFDWKKSFRPLLKADSSVMCFTIGNDSVSNLFRTNINRPPKGISPREWINVLCDLLTESFCVSFGVHKVLMETLDEVFEGWGIYKGSPHYPNWQHIKKMLEIKAREARGREATWYESALRIATVLTFGDFGKVINYDGKKSLSIEDLYDKKVILELNSLGNVEKKFFCEFILTYLYKLKKANQLKISEGFNHAIIVDEAHNIFLKNKTYFVSESVTDMVYREMREYGTGLICLDQHISKLSDTVKGNSACHIAFQQQLPQDVYDISSIMQIPEKKELFTQLPVGVAVVKLSERYTFPFSIKVPFTELRNEIIDDKIIAKRMECIVQGIEVEKDDPEFKEALINPSNPKSLEVVPVTEIKLEIKTLEPQEKIEEVKLESTLTPTQEILRSFISEQLQKGRSLREIEELLERRLFEKCYTSRDILEAINSLINLRLNKEEFELNLKKDKMEKYPILKTLDKEEMDFIVYLIENSLHEDSTVELYNKMKLSTRKGNIIKNKLLDKDLIRIQEEKNARGWKKFIRLTENVHAH
ncbi:MAG TPA: DUF87 domain-containing protein [Candidatus Pacearchaeota archaeon]|nr:DUF87 domain-containing protein [Candidatus Pacearchaeota archaeon]